MSEPHSLRHFHGLSRINEREDVASEPGRSTPGSSGHDVRQGSTKEVHVSFMIGFEGAKKYDIVHVKRNGSRVDCRAADNP